MKVRVVLIVELDKKLVEETYEENQTAQEIREWVKHEAAEATEMALVSVEAKVNFR